MYRPFLFKPVIVIEIFSRTQGPNNKVLERDLVTSIGQNGDGSGNHYSYLMEWQYTIMHSPLDYSVHARMMMQERMIEEDWVIATVNSPEKIVKRRDDEIHYLKRIPQNKNKYLRVIINPSISPSRVITVFFDRRVQQ